MINYISKYFTLNRRERNGVIAFCTLFLILFAVKYVIIYQYNPTATVTVVNLDNVAAKLAEQNKVVEKNGYTSASTKANNNFKTESKFVSKKQNITLEINSADSLQWIQLKGIKGGRARMILKYKNMLGGFYNIEQLKEVYTINDTVYDEIKQSLTVNPSLIQKLKVNAVDFKTMVHHPYIKYEGTKCIFALKKNKKITADDLKNSSCFSREQLEKVLVYLDFD